MKKNIQYIAALLLICFATACTKQLDTSPTSSINSEDALKTSADVEGLLKGTYASLGSGSFLGGDVFVESELLADDNDIDWTGTYQELTQIHNKAITTDNSFVASNWTQGYKVINQANIILDSISLVVEPDRLAVKAGAEFIRGASYFYLVNLFAKSWNNGDPASNPGVPVVLKSTDPTKDLPESAKVKRNTVAEVYAQIITDLTDAEENLPEDNGFYANQAAAAFMLARVYLQKGDYTNAAAAANRAIGYADDLGKFLVGDYYDVFPYVDPPAAVPNTSEDIFALQVNSTSGVNDFQTYFSALGRGDASITDDHLAKYEDGDDRLNLFYTSGGYTFTGKFDNLYGNVQIMRLAELYLIRAEANFRMHTNVGAKPVTDINTVRERVLLPDYSSGELTLDKILHERYVELAFEGSRLMDIKRTETSLTTTVWNSPKLVFPIPKREIQVNSNLTQNEGY